MALHNRAEDIEHQVNAPSRIRVDKTQKRNSVFSSTKKSSMPSFLVDHLTVTIQSLYNTIVKTEKCLHWLVQLYRKYSRSTNGAYQHQRSFPYL